MNPAGIIFTFIPIFQMFLMEEGAHKSKSA